MKAEKIMERITALEGELEEHRQALKQAEKAGHDATLSGDTVAAEQADETAGKGKAAISRLESSLEQLRQDHRRARQDEAAAEIEKRARQLEKEGMAVYSEVEKLLPKFVEIFNKIQALHPESLELRQSVGARGGGILFRLMRYPHLAAGVDRDRQARQITDAMVGEVLENLKISISVSVGEFVKTKKSTEELKWKKMIA